MGDERDWTGGNGMLLKDAIAQAKHNHGNQHTVNRIQPILFAPLNTRQWEGIRLWGSCDEGEDMKYDAIELGHIVYDPKSRNGTWCCSPYEGHPHGCPNFIKGCTSRPSLTELTTKYSRWFAVVETFDLKSHAERMKAKHLEHIGKNGKIVPAWTERQCRNPLYWQGTVRHNLKIKAAKLQDYLEYLYKSRGFLLDIPEANGVDVFETMAKAGIILEKKPDIVRKVMIVGLEATA
jgi:hypothetical protein